MSDKIDIITESGQRVEAIAPVIISASRSTDIPAFYAEWFVNRLKKGYCIWINPFSGRKSYVSFKNCKVIVFWSKNPKPMIPYLSELDCRGIHYYFNYTLNDYVEEGLEPGIPPLDDRIATFRELSATIGSERVIWRFDPLIVTPSLTPRCLLKRIWNIGNQIRCCTDRFVFSFVDISPYRKVQRNLMKACPDFAGASVLDVELSPMQIYEIAEGLSKINKAWQDSGWNIDFATCGEAIDLEEFGIRHNSCIDGHLIEHLFGYDKELVYYLRTGRLPEINLFGEFDMPESGMLSKDKGQRKECLCIPSKDIGMYSTCPHLCAYCYANADTEKVMKNYTAHNKLEEGIVYTTPSSG